MGPAGLRCPFCHDVLGAVAAAPCERCGASTHLACLIEHGACPILGCAPVEDAGVQAPLPQRGEPVDWEDLVRDAAPWLEVGASLAEQGVWTAFPEGLLAGAEGAAGGRSPHGSSWADSSSRTTPSSPWTLSSSRTPSNLWVASSWVG